MPAIDVTRRIEPGTVAVLDRLTRWDLTSIETIRSSYAAAGAPPAPADPRVTRSDAVIAGCGGRPDVAVRWYRPAGSARRPGSRAWCGCTAALTSWAPWTRTTAGWTGWSSSSAARWSPSTGGSLRNTRTPKDWTTRTPCGALSTGDPAVDPARLAVGGASSGAGLAAALCLRLRDTGQPQPALQLLIYPMLDDREVTASIRASEDPGHWGLWHLAANRMCWQAYLGPLCGSDVPATAAPARAEDLSGLASGLPRRRRRGRVPR